MAMILAIQPDSGQASALRHALRAWAGAAVVIVESAEAALAAIDQQKPDLVLLHAFMTLGDETRVVRHLRALPNAGRLQTLLDVTLPLALPGIITGMVLSFARGLGEFGATITFVSNIPGETRTLPLAIYTYTQVPSGDESALRLSLIAIAVSLAALFASEVLVRRATRRIMGDDPEAGH